MSRAARQLQRTYLLLTLFSTLASSTIWGINTIFLLDAGLSNTEAFLANSFFMLGMMIFEVPTGMVADWWGRRTSYLLGTIVLAISTLFYLGAWVYQWPFAVWAFASVLIGLGFTFFSGATEAWLVDGMKASGFTGNMEAVFGKGQSVSGIAMLIGSVGGGVIAQATNLGVPYILRAGLLFLTFGIAFFQMKDVGFTPTIKNHNNISKPSANTSFFAWYGLDTRALLFMMLAGPFGSGVGFYVFYALQPYLLQLYGDPSAYWIAGLTAAIVAGSQIVGGMAVPKVSAFIHRRSTLLFTATFISSGILLSIAVVGNFYAAVFLIILWAFLGSLVRPVRQAYINGIIRSDQRATVLSFDSLVSSFGGVVIQPVLGRIADTSGYAFSYMVGSGIQTLALPLLHLARKEKGEWDRI